MNDESAPSTTRHVALVSGAAQGMGAAEADALARDGFAVVVGDVQLDGAQEVAAGITDRGDTALPVHLDVTEPESWAAAVRTAEGLGQLRALVNNAGVTRRLGLLQTTPEDLQAVLNVNLTGSWLGIQAVEPALRSHGGGSIVNISSVAAMTAYPAAAYSVSKWAVRGLTKVAVLELAPAGIRVNSVHPGIIDTPMLDSADDRLRDAFASAAPLDRPGLPEEVAQAVVYLCSDRSGYVTGAELTVDGGFTAAGTFRGVQHQMTCED